MYLELLYSPDGISARMLKSTAGSIPAVDLSILAEMPRCSNAEMLKSTAGIIILPVYIYLSIQAEMPSGLVALKT